MVTFKQASKANLIIALAAVVVTFGGGYISNVALDWLFPHSLIVFSLTIVLVAGLCYSGHIFSKMTEGYDFKK